MLSRATAELIRSALESAGVSLSPSQAIATEAYFGLLTKWSNLLNLTGFSLDSPSRESVNRLLVEPFLAARTVATVGNGARLVDVGSGGGSPAVPLAIGTPAISLTMVESRERKAAFLREVIREVGLVNASVECARAEKLAEDPLHRGRADVVSIRAVRLNAAMSNAIAGLLAPHGRVLWFQPTNDRLADSSLRDLRHERSESLGADARLDILVRAAHRQL